MILRNTHTPLPPSSLSPHTHLLLRKHTHKMQVKKKEKCCFRIRDKRCSFTSVWVIRKCVIVCGNRRACGNACVCVCALRMCVCELLCECEEVWVRQLKYLIYGRGVSGILLKGGTRERGLILCCKFKLRVFFFAQREDFVCCENFVFLAFGGRRGVRQARTNRNRSRTKSNRRRRRRRRTRKRLRGRNHDLAVKENVAGGRSGVRGGPQKLCKPCALRLRFPAHSPPQG